MARLSVHSIVHPQTLLLLGALIIHGVAVDGLAALGRASRAGHCPREFSKIKDLQPQNEGMLQSIIQSFPLSSNFAVVTLS
jgi:hypothetical protein